MTAVWMAQEEFCRPEGVENAAHLAGQSSWDGLPATYSTESKPERAIEACQDVPPTAVPKLSPRMRKVPHREAELQFCSTREMVGRKARRGTSPGRGAREGTEAAEKGDRLKLTESPPV